MNKIFTFKKFKENCRHHDGDIKKRMYCYKGSCLCLEKNCPVWEKQFDATIKWMTFRENAKRVEEGSIIEKTHNV